jgi:hypothetical protein
VKERFSTGGRVGLTDYVVKERVPTSSNVVDTGCVAKERLKTNGRIGGASGKAEEGLTSFSRVATWIASVRWRANGSSRRRKRKADEQKLDEKETAS